MDNKLLSILLTGTAVISAGIGSGITELVNNEDVSLVSQTEQIEAVQPTLYVDDKCAEDSLLIGIGKMQMCSSKDIYDSLKQMIVTDLEMKDTSWQLADGTACTEGEEGCIGNTYTLDIENKDVFTAVLIKEMIKSGEIKSLSEDPETARAEALEIIKGDTKVEDLEIINP
jgi:hypothetical protein